MIKKRKLQVWIGVWISVITGFDYQLTWFRIFGLKLKFKTEVNLSFGSKLYSKT